MGRFIHDGIQQEMFRIYSQREHPIYLDPTAKDLFEEGLDSFHSLGLTQNKILQFENTIHLIPWIGDKILNTLEVLLSTEGLKVDIHGGIITIPDINQATLFMMLEKIHKNPISDPSKLSSQSLDTHVEKHDCFLNKKIRFIGYGVNSFDLDGTYQFINTLLK